MKLLPTKLTCLGLGLVATAFLHAAPIDHFDHPNYRVALPALLVGELLNLDTEGIRRQNPQYEVYFAGDIVGLFSRVPYGPVWTTLNVGWLMPEEPTYERWGQLGTGTEIPRNLLPACGLLRPCAPPPCATVSACNAPDGELNLVPNPPSVLPNPPSVLPDPPAVVPDPPVVTPELVTQTPEPSSQWLSLIGVALLGLIWKLR